MNIDLLKDLAVTVIIAILGNVTVGMIFKLPLNKLVNLAMSKVLLAEETNLIGTATAEKIYKEINEFKKSTEIKVDKLVEIVTELVNMVKERDIKIATLIKDNLGDNDGKEEIN